jgi:hypothetical protein
MLPRTLARAAAWVALTFVLALSLVVIFKEATRPSPTTNVSPVFAPTQPAQKTGPWHYAAESTRV